jgi:hypothetical protein
VAFCIGLNRTGTTTFGDAAAILGFSRLGWTPQSHFLVKAWQQGDFERLRTVAAGYDVLEDLPWPLAYREMAECYPDARFVLTRRRSVATWLESQTFHTRNEYGMHRVIYGAASAAEAPELYREMYERHVADVRGFFAGSDRLLEVCWEEGDGWPELCGFLGVPEPADRPFPHSNSRPGLRARVRGLVRTLRG